MAADLGAEGVAACLREVGLGFMFASRFNPAMAAVNPTRKALRVRTAFNLLGPLLNPARTPFSLARAHHPLPCPFNPWKFPRRRGKAKGTSPHSYRDTGHCNHAMCVFPGKAVWVPVALVLQSSLAAGPLFLSAS